MHSRLCCGLPRTWNPTNILALNIFKYNDLTCRFLKFFLFRKVHLKVVVKLSKLFWWRKVYFKISEYLHSSVLIFNNIQKHLTHMQKLKLFAKDVVHHLNCPIWVIRLLKVMQQVFVSVSHFECDTVVRNIVWFMCTGNLVTFNYYMI